LRGTAVAELIRTPWRFALGGKNSVAPSRYRSAAGKVMSSMKTSSSAASATAISLGPFAPLQQMRIRLLPQGLVSGSGNRLRSS
jgi:hypothetical protein